MKIELVARAGAPDFVADVLVVGAFAVKEPKDEKGAKHAGEDGKKASKKQPKADASKAPWAANEALDALDQTLGGALVAQARREEFSGKPNSALIINTLGRAP